MRARTLAAAMAVLALGIAAPPATALPDAPASVSAGQVKYPKAVPGRYCKRSHRGDWTKTARYGKLKCKNDNGWRWTR